jgi:hypothetical protein
MPNIADISRGKAEGAANGISANMPRGIFMKNDIEELLDQRDGLRVVQ